MKINFKKIAIIAVCIFVILLIIFVLPWDKMLKSEEEKANERVILEVVTPNELTLNVGDIYELDCSATLDGKPYEVIAYTVSNKEVLNVTSDGVVNVLKTGSCTIYIASGNKTESINVVVLKPEAKQIMINRVNNVNIVLGNTLQLSCSAVDENAELGEVIWESSNKGVATIDQNGLVTSVGKGQVTITVSIKDNLSVKASITLYVIE